MHVPRVLAILAGLALAAGASAQEQPGRYVPRDEMIDAIVHYAASGGCETRRKVFGSAFEATCLQPPADGDERMTMLRLLESRSQRDLIELCRGNAIADCEQPREVSTGRPVLTFTSQFEVDFTSQQATWSPDGRLLLLDYLNPPAGEVRLLDVAAGRLLDPPLYAGPIRDAAWSPDGAHIVLSDRKRAAPMQAPPVGSIRLYDAGTRRERARISVAQAGCSLSLLEGMAFTADSKALWVLCSQSDKTAKAVRLTVPDLTVETSFVPASPSAGLPEVYWEEGILRHGGDLIVTARFRSPPPGHRSAVQSYSLRTRQPLHAPIPAAAGAARLTPDLSGVLVGSELWSMRTGERVATGVAATGRYLGAPGRLPQLGMHLETRPQPQSRRMVLAVVDSATGAKVQEIGPLPTVLSILVAPDGRMVGVAGFHGIRFYRVGPASAAAQGR